MINSEQASMNIFLLQLILIWISKYSCPALALAAIGGKNKACSGGNVGTTLQNKGCVGSCGNRCKCDDFVDNWYHESENMNQYANPSCLCFYVSCVNVIVEEAFRTTKVRRSSHRKAANDLLQWPTSPKWHIFAHLLDCSIVPPCADWCSGAIGLSPPEAETWNSLAHALTEFRIGKRILVDDLRSFRRRRSKDCFTNRHMVGL